MTAVAVILCGRVLQRGFDARILIVAGMFVYMGAMWLLGHLTTQSGLSDTQTGLMVRGFGLGLVFIPISTVAFAGLQGAQIAQGAALYNLMRQLGGSFGIAVLNTYIVNMTAYHRADIVASLHPGDAAFSARVSGIAGGLKSGGLSPDAAQAAALRLLDHSGSGAGDDDGLQQRLYPARPDIPAGPARRAAPAPPQTRRPGPGGGALKKVYSSRYSGILNHLSCFLGRFIT